jgi:hypothetical protein
MISVTEDLQLNPSRPIYRSFAVTCNLDSQRSIARLEPIHGRDEDGLLYLFKPLAPSFTLCYNNSHLLSQHSFDIIQHLFTRKIFRSVITKF